MSKNIFEMSTEEFDEWIKGDEAQQLAEAFSNYVKQEIERNPYFCAPICWKWNCPYNTGNDHYVEMGEVTTCHKWKDDEEHEPCPDIEEDWLI